MIEKISPVKRSLDEHRKEIEDIVKEKKGTIIGQEQMKKGKNDIPFFKIICNKGHEFKISKYALQPAPNRNGAWCPHPDCKKSLRDSNLRARLDTHRKDIEKNVKEKGGTIIGQKWRKTGKRHAPYFEVECGYGHKFWNWKYDLKKGAWCPHPDCKAIRRITLDEHRKEIEDIVNEKKGTIIDQEWRKLSGNTFPFFKIICSKGHEFWVSKYNLTGSKDRDKGGWCPHPDCRYRSLDDHRREIEKIVKEKGGIIIGQKWFFKIKEGKNFRFPFFLIRCHKGHEWLVVKGSLKPKLNNPRGSWCPVCQDRLKSIGSFSHVPIEYFSLIYLMDRNCKVRIEETLREGTRPDLIIEKNEVFKKNIEANQNVISFLSYIKEIAIDFTISMTYKFISSKCFRNYQNNTRFLLIVLMREEGISTAHYFQRLIDIDENINDEDKKRIKVINFNEYLDFLNLGRWNIYKTKKEKKIESKLRGIVKSCIKSINSDSALKKLTRLYNKYKTLILSINLEKIFEDQENRENLEEENEGSKDTAKLSEESKDNQENGKVSEAKSKRVKGKKEKQKAKMSEGSFESQQYSTQSKPHPYDLNNEQYDFEDFEDDFLRLSGKVREDINANVETMLNQVRERAKRKENLISISEPPRYDNRSELDSHLHKKRGLKKQSEVSIENSDDELQAEKVKRSPEHPMKKLNKKRKALFGESSIEKMIIPEQLSHSFT